MSEKLKEEALEYHRAEPPGKLAITATKPMATQHDLTLAYSPGVASACEVIVSDEREAATVTGRGNLVGVVTNGTAVLGLGSIGALAAKPVMEGKAVLFKKFSGINVFDIEIEERDPGKFVEIVAGLEATFGGINLEDIKAPECFEIERLLRKRMRIPVFHDDQHGTAIVTAAAITSALKVVNKAMDKVHLVASGAGAASLACLDLLVSLGMRREHITILDRKGVVYHGRQQNIDQYKAKFASDTSARTLSDALQDADIFLGLSGPGVLAPEQLKIMGNQPIILALANPIPEIMPGIAKEARPDAIIATGRSDYPNQVNNVLCFPFIFRGALDVGASEINEDMKVACVKALSELAESESSDVVRKAYAGEPLSFGPEYLIPKPFDPRLITEVAPAVAKAAMDSGVAARPIANLSQYKQDLSQFVYKSSGVMEPIFDRAKEAPKRICYAEGDNDNILHAAQQAIDAGIAKPILVGKPEAINQRIRDLKLRIREGKDFQIVNPAEDPRLDEFSREFYRLKCRQGVSPTRSRYIVRSHNTAFSSLMVRLGYADALLCGTIGAFREHLEHVSDIVGKAPDVSDFSSLVVLILPTGTFFICDTHVTYQPSAYEISEMTVLAASEVERFGITPKVALVSHSNFGTRQDGSSAKMQAALQLLRHGAPHLQVDGEMHADAAVLEDIRRIVLPDSTLRGSANLLIMPNGDAAHISYNLLKVLGGGVSVGPILLGAAKPAHVTTQTITVRGLVNMTAIAVVDAQIQEKERAESHGADA
ncbi:MAG: NADP-dependent malic enzyme [Gammaproteobacteria bacterium]|nr:NADP-dependent malic enzyme [Gammaproteobacteria bacterium]